MHYLYRITNLVNNKIYIGQAKDYNQRWRQHKQEAKREIPRMIVNVAMKKYGLDNFIFEIIATCKTQEDANQTETLLVSQYESHISTGKGYNVSNGGMNAPKTEAFKQQMRDHWADPEYKQSVSVAISKAYSEQTPEEKEEKSKLLSEILSGQHLSPDTEFKNGHQPSIDTLKKISENKMGIEPWNKGTIGAMKPNSGSFKLGYQSPIKGTHITNSGSFSSGSKHKGAKLSESQVLEIVKLNEQGISKREIANKFNVKIDTIYGITRGRNWNNITGIKKAS